MIRRINQMPQTKSDVLDDPTTREPRPGVWGHVVLAVRKCRRPRRIGKCESECPKRITNVPKVERCHKFVAGSSVMSIFTNITIGGRLKLAFASLFLAVVLVGGAGLLQAAKLKAVTAEIANHRLPSIRALDRIAEAMARFRTVRASALLATSAEMTAGSLRRQSETIAEPQAARKAFEPGVDPGEEQQSLAPAI